MYISLSLWHKCTCTIVLLQVLPIWNYNIFLSYWWFEESIPKDLRRLGRQEWIELIFDTLYWCEPYSIEGVLHTPAQKVVRRAKVANSSLSVSWFQYIWHPVFRHKVKHIWIRKKNLILVYWKRRIRPVAFKRMFEIWKWLLFISKIAKRQTRFPGCITYLCDQKNVWIPQFSKAFHSNTNLLFSVTYLLHSRFFSLLSSLSPHAKDSFKQKTEHTAWLIAFKKFYIVCLPTWSRTLHPILHATQQCLWYLLSSEITSW